MKMSEKTRLTSKTPETKKGNSISPARKTDFFHTTSSPIDHILFLHRTIGNQAVQRLFKSGVLQGKFKISQPNDIYEQEADRVAEQVMRMPENTGFREQGLGVRNKDEFIQSKSACPSCKEEEEELIQTKSIADQITPLVQRQVGKEEETLQTKKDLGQTPEVTSNLESSINALKGSGQPLPESVRNFFEPRFGHDFSQVRVHTDAKAAESARAVNALAYTVEQNIVFRSGAYRPETVAGRRLLAHELAHVGQQTWGTSIPLVQRYEGTEHQDIGDRFLRELETFLQTEDGARWAQELGFNPDDLVAQILSDPMLHGARIRLRSRVNVEFSGVEVENVELTPGEIIALMGDFYKTVDDLANAPAGEIRSILDVMQQQRDATVPDAESRYQEITHGRYLELAESNYTHFAPDNQAKWKRLHGDAIDKAQGARRAQSREQKENLFQDALLIDAAACHFLTDSYAAGHLFNVHEVLYSIESYLNEHFPVTGSLLDIPVSILDNTGKLPQVVLKNVHDMMNQRGLEVSNARGMRWRTYGDNYLESLAPETQRIAALAVFLSRQQVFAAYKGEATDPHEIEELMPDEDSIQRATTQAYGYIPDAVLSVRGLIVQYRDLAPSVFDFPLGFIIESLLESADVDYQIKLQRERREEMFRALRPWNETLGWPMLSIGWYFSLFEPR